MGKKRRKDPNISVTQHAIDRFADSNGTTYRAEDLVRKFYRMARQLKAVGHDGSVKYRYGKWLIVVRDGAIVTCIHNSSDRYSTPRGT